MTPNWNVLTSSPLQYLILLSRLAFSLEMNIKCPEGGEFKHRLPLAGCRQYYVCNGSRSIEHRTCPPGTIYSPIAEACKVGGTCNDIVCTGRVDGRYADTTEGCKRWFECQGGFIQAVESCPLGYQFSEPHNSCTPSHLTSCAAPKSTSVEVLKITNPCDGQPDGYYSVFGSKNYVKCVHQIEVETHTCPPNQKFDGWSCSLQLFKDTCSLKSDGYYVQDSDDCTEYVICQNRQVVSRGKCPTGTSFNGKVCDPSSFQICGSKQDSKCRGLPDNYYPNTGQNCSTYYQCKENNLITEESCPQGLIWNGSYCALKSTFNCEESNDAKECLGRRGYYEDVLSKCQKYHYCRYGKKIEFHCREGHVFNGTECVPSGTYKCPSTQQNTCDGKSPGYYIDTESNCQSYYYCANRHKIVYVCPPNEVFDGSKCVTKNEFKCHLPENTDCKGRPNGYQRVQKRSVRGYIYCFNGIKLVTLFCESHEVYDGEKCVDFRKYKSKCYNIKFGHITDSSCRNYYSCREGEVIKSGVCLDRFVFDGKSCVPPSNGQCNRGSIATCLGIPNGFYTDFNTNCEQYFSCINGIRTLLKCPEGQVHNGDICVPNYQYVCPSLAETIT